ncbi:MAG TPA: hypothetical protein VF812_11155 [Ktedonobacterales bacterium]
MSQYEDLLIDALLDYGFTLEEAERLIELQERNDALRRPLASDLDPTNWFDSGENHMWN